MLRIHHAVADGMAAVAIVQQLFDPDEPREVPSNEPSGRAPMVAPRRGLRHTLRRLRVGLRRIRKTLRGSYVGRTMLLGERSPYRGVVFLRSDIDALQAGVRLRGGTVNDALLAASASGFRAALTAAGEPIPTRLPACVPVALQRRGTAGNQVGVMLVQLSLGEPDPDERLRLITEQTPQEKVSAREHGTLEFMRGPSRTFFMSQVAALRRARVRALRQWRCAWSGVVHRRERSDICDRGSIVSARPLSATGRRSAGRYDDPALG
ncbi:wax ester/triacylglycerol synthase domain-containing protein [Microbacterium sp. Gd 4-13]|uniref:wax ester/triacylglycerol synthase domain-containing protein n=1 Tax=Microbacterium sp. Gd 4-13 TaxID=2173179 RepID=UPI001F0C5481|nr:wax ester/triacylglycerol synthase domain-containing protein [Microbacterium sp. Gd 4-13]